MSLIITQEGAEQLWQQLFGISTIGYPNLHLIGSAFTPAHMDRYSTYAALELAVAGYAPKSLTQPSIDWTFTQLTAGGMATYVQVNWTFTAACSVYGYWLADQADAYALYSEAFASPVNFGAGGGAFPLQLMPTLTSMP